MVGVAAQESDLDKSSLFGIGNLLCGGYLYDIIAVSPFASAKIVGSYSVRADPVDAANLEQQILVWFIDVSSKNPEVLFHGDLRAYFHVERARKQAFPSGPTKHLRIRNHSLAEVANTFLYPSSDSDHRDYLQLVVCAANAELTGRGF
jgi:hypothetical protein